MGEAPGEAIQAVLEENPLFRRTVEDFMILTDAADVLEQRDAPNAAIAAAYLRETARAIVHQAGLPDDFTDAMMSSRPPRA